ncbi:MAG TPA: glycosyltransferase, partial [Cellvibrionaceae bacterium]|nr:glycosyltransferase [Cellvibrionaceae bacterium]
MIKVTHYSGDRIGGAARAATRLHRALNQNEDVDSRMVVAERLDDDYTIEELDKGVPGKLNAMFKAGIDGLPRRLAWNADSTPRSAGWAAKLTAKAVDSNASDIAHLHWINGGFLSVEEIGKITKPIVWTFHDMWPFCGAEHLAPDTENARWKVGYNRPNEIKGFDFDRWTWKRKKAHWLKPFHIVAPSSWMAECVSNSEM